MALGMKPNNDLYKELEQEEIPVEMIGDAVKARKVIHAVHEGTTPEEEAKQTCPLCPFAF